MLAGVVADCQKARELCLKNLQYGVAQHTVQRSPVTIHVGGFSPHDQRNAKPATHHNRMPVEQWRIAIDQAGGWLEVPQTLEKLQRSCKEKGIDWR